MSSGRAMVLVKIAEAPLRMESDAAMDERKIELARKFANGAVTVWPVNAGPDQGFAERFRPRVAGLNVAPTGMPKDGYLTRGEAIAGGEQYREACRRAVGDEK